MRVEEEGVAFVESSHARYELGAERVEAGAAAGRRLALRVAAAVAVVISLMPFPEKLPSLNSCYLPGYLFSQGLDFFLQSVEFVPSSF